VETGHGSVVATWGLARRRAALVVLALLTLFAFRLAFGLASEFWFEDETQIFLLGLRYQATGAWPFFGPDVVWTKSEIPGALQALLIGLPLKAVPIPESPFVLLNLLSFAALSAFAWYTCRRLPSLPRWLVWGWFFTIPWTLQFSTHVINPSYVLPAAIVFFIGFFEAVPEFSLGCIPAAAAHFMMGASLTWLMQIHMSWPLLLPYIALAWFSRRDQGRTGMAVNAVALMAGAAIPGALLAPTLLMHGAARGSGGTFRNLHVHAVSPWVLVTTLARFFSFASLEVNRFLGITAATRLELFVHHWWLLPAAVVVAAVGIVQPVWMLSELCRSARRWPSPFGFAHWRALRRLVVASVLVVYFSYFLVMEPAQAHAFYVLAPIALLFAAYCWTVVDRPATRRIAAVVLTLNIAFQAGLAWARAPRRSLYENREVVAAAIRQKDPELLGHRRAFAFDGGPAMLAGIAYDAQRSMALVRSSYSIGVLGLMQWTLTIQNESGEVAFRDVWCETRYFNARGDVVDRRYELIKDVFQPRELKSIELTDGLARIPFTTADIRVIRAEALRPIRRAG
jgi:hypothetical protein